jgi:4'-phosphopantetheinyl transferase EntD
MDTQSIGSLPDPLAVDRAALDAALRSIAPEGVTVGVRRISEHDMSALFAVELAMVESAVRKRQHEFASGRVLLRELTGQSAPVLSEQNRAPALPPGIVGSLAHDRDFVVAAISRDPRIRSIGIDLEPMDPLTDDLARAILRHDEIDLDPHLAFVLKEATYKAWSSMGGHVLDHHDVHLTLHDTRFRADVGSSSFDGQFALRVDRCVALVVVAN